MQLGIKWICFVLCCRAFLISYSFDQTICAWHCCYWMCFIVRGMIVRHCLWNMLIKSVEFGRCLSVMDYFQQFVIVVQFLEHWGFGWICLYGLNYTYFLIDCFQFISWLSIISVYLYWTAQYWVTIRVKAVKAFNFKMFYELICFCSTCNIII